MQNGAKWFESIPEVVDAQIDAGDKRIVVFYCSPDRDADALTAPLREVCACDCVGL
jgi:hypothetical protein